MIRGLFWRSLLLSTLFLGVTAFVAAAAAAPVFASDRQTLLVAAILAAVGAPLWAVGQAWLLRARLSRAMDEVAAGVRSIVAREAHQLPKLEDPGGDLDPLVGTINRLAGEVEAGIASATEKERLLRRTLDELGEGVLFLDSNRTIVIANQAAELMLGMGRLEAKRLLEVIRAPELTALVEDGAGRLELPERGTRPRLQIDSRLLDEGGRLLSLRDVGELRRLERVRSDFVANVSHELRTPVAAVKMNVETLIGGAMDDPAARDGFLEAIARNADRLESLLSDLLDLASVEQGRRELHPEQLSVLEVVREVEEALGEEALRREATIEHAIDPALRVFADRLALHQILHNLVENGLHHGNHPGRVELSARGDDGEVELTVSDDGPGIEARHHARIFERFYRADPGRSRAAGGTGLGLSIVRNLTEALGGSVGVRAREPRGSVFWVRLPAGP